MPDRQTHRALSLKIHYYGTPVVLVSTRNPDGSPNLAPISSVWWLDQTAVVGVGARSQTARNLRRERECVLNLPSAELVDAVNRLALTTGRAPVPAYKTAMGFEHVADKFARSGLTESASECVGPPRVAECPVQIEGRVADVRAIGDADDHAVAVEVRVVRTHLDEAVLDPDRRHHVDPDRWRPLIMSFCEFYGLGPRLRPSRLADVF